MNIQVLLKFLPPSLMLLGALYAALNESLTGVIIFTVSSALVGFLAFLERRRLDDLDLLHGEINILKNRIDAITIGKSMGL
jgi:hypothetical protein